MKKILGIVVLNLFLISTTQADDIRDFQIEGMSIGDSLLDYMTENEIELNKMNYDGQQKSKFYTISYTGKKTIYEIIEITLKKKR